MTRKIKNKKFKMGFEGITNKEFVEASCTEN